jgi:DNA (cytosine-5)-methyltransferase 1
MSSQRTLTFFSGIGGFSLAFEAEGFRTIGFSEIDPYACAVLRKHWPGVTNYGDVRAIPAIGCDVITGGFPCQPFPAPGTSEAQQPDDWPTR